jgi:hypothetical protein
LLDQTDLDLRFVLTADVAADARILSDFDFVLLAGADGELAELQIAPYVLPADRVATLNLQQPASSFVEPTLRVALNLSFTCGSRTLPSCMQIRRDCTVEFARIRSFTSGGLKKDRYFGSCCTILASLVPSLSLSQDGAMYCSEEEAPRSNSDSWEDVIRTYSWSQFELGVDPNNVALSNPTVQAAVESGLECGSEKRSFIRDHLCCRLTHVSCCDAEGAIVAHSSAPLASSGVGTADDQLQVFHLVEMLFGGKKEIGVRTVHGAYEEYGCTDVIENAYTFGFLLDCVYGHFLGETLPMLFSTIVQHEGDAFEASASTRTLLHAFSAPPLTVAIEPMMSLLRIFSLRPVLSLEDIRWRFPRRVCFRSLVLGNDNSMIFSLQHGEAWEQAGSMREIRRVVDAADVRTSMWLSFRALLLSATAAAASTRPPPTLPHLRVTIATRRGSDRGITNLMALVNITRSMSSIAEASAVAVRPPAAALVWSASLACDRQLHLRRLSSVTAAHERCLCLQLETLRVADQFQLLLSTHIFVSMISSAVCNAVCALDDSALEALARKAVSSAVVPLRHRCVRFSCRRGPSSPSSYRSTGARTGQMILIRRARSARSQRSSRSTP